LLVHLKAAKLISGIFIFVFPASENGNFDPARPQETWRTAWRKLTRAITCPSCVDLADPGDLCRNENCKTDVRSLRSPIGELSECNPSVFQTMTNTSDKFSGGGGDVAPSPRSLGSSRDGKKTQSTANVPIEKCLTTGVQSTSLGPKWVQNPPIKGLKTN